MWENLNIPIPIKHYTTVPEQQQYIIANAVFLLV